MDGSLDPYHFWEAGNENVRSTRRSRGRRRWSSRPVDVGSVTAAASGPPATDAGADPSAAAGHPTGGPSRGSLGQPTEQSRDSGRPQWFVEGRHLGPMAFDEFHRSEGARIAARSRASVSAAPRAE